MCVCGGGARKEIIITYLPHLIGLAGMNCIHGHILQRHLNILSSTVEFCVMPQASLHLRHKYSSNHFIFPHPGGVPRGANDKLDAIIWLFPSILFHTALDCFISEPIHIAPKMRGATTTQGAHFNRDANPNEQLSCTKLAPSLDSLFLETICLSAISHLAFVR